MIAGLLPREAGTFPAALPFEPPAAANDAPARRTRPSAAANDVVVLPRIIITSRTRLASRRPRDPEAVYVIPSERRVEMGGRSTVLSEAAWELALSLMAIHTSLTVAGPA